MSALLWWCDFTYTICRVTLPTERVSWNAASIILFLCSPSRSPRSVWVEILQVVLYSDIEVVTLPTERVSWNLYGSQTLPHVFLSRSPRSVWVEIYTAVRRSHTSFCHAPQGACELKYFLYEKSTPKGASRSPRSVWVEIRNRSPNTTNS